VGGTVAAVPASALSSPVRGACPGVAAPMAAADGLLLRVRVPGGAVTPDGLRAVAEVARRFGSGTVELTVRANLQIRGLRPAAADAAAAHLVAAGLAEADPTRDERRDVVASPLAGHDPTELADLSGSVRAVSRLLAAAPGLDGLPPKFGVVLDGGGAAAPVRTIAADVALGAVRAADGSVAMGVELGRPLAAGDGTGQRSGSPAVVPLAAVDGVVLAAARRCAATGERMAALAADEAGRAALVADLVAEAGFAGSLLPAPPADVRVTPAEPAALTSAGAGPPPIGVLDHHQADRANLGAAPLLGRTGPSALRRVAALAEATGAAVRLTPWRGLVLAGLPRADLAACAAALAHAGWSSDRDDPVHLVSACVGLPGCSSSRADTGRAARDLLDSPRSLTTRLHLSGCDKCCGAGTDALVVVAGDDGRFAGVDVPCTVEVP
jgi:precorrin-3B synthase